MPDIEFVTYQYEGFRSQKSSILSVFLKKYPQKNLNEKEKKDLYRILFEFMNSFSYTELTEIFFSLQLMIKMLSEQPILDKDVMIKDIKTSVLFDLFLKK